MSPESLIESISTVFSVIYSISTVTLSLELDLVTAVPVVCMCDPQPQLLLWSHFSEEYMLLVSDVL